MKKKPGKIYGLLARFDGPEALMVGARRLREAGYKSFDAYTPYPVEGLADAMGLPPSKLPLVMAAGGILGAVGGFLMQAYATVIDFPLNIGGRPLFSWPTYIPITFELTILISAFAGLIGLFVMARLPQPYHPVFNVADFIERGTTDGFYLGVEARDPKYDPEQTRNLLMEIGSRQVTEIEA